LNRDRNLRISQPNTPPRGNYRLLITGGSGFIGTHLAEELTKRKFSVLSIDLRPPLFNHHRNIWKNGDILSKPSLDVIFRLFKPTHVFHLAAKANLNGHSIEDFPENTIGTRNVIKCANDCASIERYIHFSTQYVVKPGIWPKTESYLNPYTTYGESKAVGEKLVRNECQKDWIILRPTNVWGPYHSYFPNELWNYLRLGVYLHPGYKPIIKYYAYISNAVDQIIKIAMLEKEPISGSVFYITDPPIDNADWMNAFSLALAGRPVRRISIRLWKYLANIGDSFVRLKLKFPMSSDRLFRLTVNEQLPHEATIKHTGPPRVTLNEGVHLSASWYLKWLKRNRVRRCLH
jgi:nucleoside-diphosphate-sugar epimerase